MDPTVIVLFTLASSSVLLSVALTVAWQRLGHERHALLWAMAYGLSSSNWASNIVAVIWHRSPWLSLIGATTSMASLALIAIGFRLRAGLPLYLRAFAAALITALAIDIIPIFSSGHAGQQRGIVLAFCSAMLFVSADALRNKKRRDEAAQGGAAFWMILLFGFYTSVLSVVAMLSRSTNPAYAHDFYHNLMLLGVPTGLFGVGLFAMLLLAADLAEAMRRLAACDPLTGILNRRGFEQAAGPLFASCQRTHRPLAVVTGDIDRFKGINDRFGHATGDQVLKRFVDHAQGLLRQSDLFGRLGGEEFIFVLPDTDGQGAFDAMGRVRAGLAQAVVDLVPDGTSVSFGIATVDNMFENLADVMQRADQALYQSKIEGRDRVTVAEPQAVIARFPIAPPRKARK
jgi:diguanylate cyclase (GGDEF)-like protein